MTENQKTKRAETFRAAAVLFDQDVYGYAPRPGVNRPTLTGRRVG